MSALENTVRELREVYAKHGRMPDAHYVSVETLREIEREAASMSLTTDRNLVGGQTKLLGVPLKTY